MIALEHNIWIVDGSVVSFLGFPYTTRMTVIRLACGGLWVHSPIELEKGLANTLKKIGPVKYLIAPNALHYLFIEQWQRAYPQAITYATKELRLKRKRINFDHALTNDSDSPWQGEIHQLLFTGSRMMEEAVFFHQSSATLIVTDLIENFSPEHFNPLQRFIAKLVGILAPNGKMPLEWRLSFLFSRAKARSHMHVILAWRPRRIVMAHGKIVSADVDKFLRSSFSWLAL